MEEFKTSEAQRAANKRYRDKKPEDKKKVYRRQALMYIKISSKEDIQELKKIIEQRELELDEK